VAILLVGFGNELRADDGVGPALVARLRAGGVPAGLRVEEGETDALRLASLWAGEAHVWLVDAFLRGHAPGTIHRLTHDELLALPQSHAGAHQLSLPECLRWLLLAEPALREVRFRLWGVEPANLAASRGLSSPVRAALDGLAAELRGEATHELRRDALPPRELRTRPDEPCGPTSAQVPQVP
jgi:hydrogenase maturation protease